MARHIGYWRQLMVFVRAAEFRVTRKQSGSPPFEEDPGKILSWSNRMKNEQLTVGGVKIVKD